MEISKIFFILSVGMALASQTLGSIENANKGSVIDLEKYEFPHTIDLTLHGAKKCAGLVIYTVKTNEKGKNPQIKYLVIKPLAKPGEKPTHGTLPKGILIEGDSFLQAAIQETCKLTDLTEQNFEVYGNLMIQIMLETAESKKSSIGLPHEKKDFYRMQFFLAQLKEEPLDRPIEPKYHWMNLEADEHEVWGVSEYARMMNEFAEMIRANIKYGLGYAKRSPLKSASGDLHMIARNVLEADLIKQEKETDNWMKKCCGKYNAKDLLENISKEDDKNKVKRMTPLIRDRHRYLIAVEDVDVQLTETINNLNRLIGEYNNGQNPPSIDVFRNARRDFDALMGSLKEPDMEVKKHYIRLLCYDTCRNWIRAKAIQTNPVPSFFKKISKKKSKTQQKPL